MAEEKSNIHVFLEKFHASVGTFLHITEVVVSGSIPSVCSNILFQPLDTIKTRQQIYFRRFKDTFKIIYNNDGIIGFWRGIGPTLWRIIPSSWIYFYTLDRLNFSIKINYYPDEEKIPVKIGLFTSAVSRALSCLSIIPITVVKTNFEGLGNSRPYTSTFNAIKRIFQKKGLRGLYSGTIPTLLRDVPHASLYFGFYSQIKSPLINLSKKHNLNDKKYTIIIELSSGVTSGFLATLLTHPFDVVKTKMQFHHHHPHKEYKNIIDVFKHSMKHDKFLMSGFGPRIVRRSLSTGFTWLMYEQILKMSNPTSRY